MECLDPSPGKGLELNVTGVKDTDSSTSVPTITSRLASSKQVSLVRMLKIEAQSSSRNDFGGFSSDASTSFPIAMEHPSALQAEGSALSGGLPRTLDLASNLGVNFVHRLEKFDLNQTHEWSVN